MELPREIRELLLEQLEDALADIGDQGDTEAIALAVIDCLVAATEEVDKELASGLLDDLETEGDLEDGLEDALTEALDAAGEIEFSPEDVTAVLVRLCGIEWVLSEDDEPEMLGGGVFQEEDF